MKKYFILIAALIWSTEISYTQDEDTTLNSILTDTTREFLFTSIENSDIGFIWGGDLSQDNRIGYIGDNYQRIRIRFISVIQNFDNPYEYFLYGKTRVENNICEFQGSLQITETGLVEDDANANILRAYLSGNYVLFEDQSCLHSGIFRGEFITTVYLDEEGTIYYDNLSAEEDNFTNNEFFGDWEGYYPNEVQICNWGDYRIPYSAELDMGSDEFKPSFKYMDNGWAEYLEEQKKYKNGEELEKWWQ